MNARYWGSGDATADWGTLMHRTIELPQTESIDGEMPGQHLGTLLGQVSKTSMGEIDSLISELQTLRRKLQTDGERIQREISEYAELSQQVMQLTTIISDSVKKLPRGPTISR